MPRSLAFALLLAACAPATPKQPSLPPGAEALSLLGEPLAPPDRPAETRAAAEAELAAARAEHERRPDDADALIWHARRLAYLYRYRDAVALLTEGIAKHPGDARLYRHRGHRYLTLRQLDRAVADLEHAAALRA